MTTWQRVWQRKGAIPIRSDLGLGDLMVADGFDTGAGQCDESSWRRYVHRLAARLGANGVKLSVCEVGCGAGALLHILRDLGMQVSGIDYASNQVQIARAAMPDMEFHTSEASALPFDSGTFDAVLSFGVFHYFPDLDYARRALMEMCRVAKPGGLVAVLDLPDESKRDESEAFRRGALPPDEYDRLYKDLSHLYFEKRWIRSIAEGLGTDVEVLDQDFPEYGNAVFRFNLYMRAA